MIYWNPDPDLFVIPYFNHPIKWYGLFFVIGFLFGYKYVQKDLKSYTDDPKAMIDKLIWYILAGTILGARLGHILFYEPISYLKNPLEIFMIWKGGLASHGGTVGVFIALALFVYFNKKEYPKLTFIRLLDIIAVPTALVAFFIRLGNFFNQEIIGTETNLPWGVIFGNPFDGSAIVPRHPTQLYEGLCYLAIFFFLLWYKRQNPAPGKIIGWFFVLVFTSRFFLEYTKEVQPSPYNLEYLQVGQWLSIPIIALGVYFILRAKRSPQIN